MKITIVLGALAAVILLFLGFIFILSAGAETVSTQPELQTFRLIEGGIMLAVAFALVYVTYIFSRKPTTIVQQLELSGAMKASSIKCPNCSASVDTGKIKIVQGVPYATCPYCGTTFEVIEEPKW
jgi:DNA-directed RNA polymerase subunit RPC12/RpoP